MTGHNSRRKPAHGGHRAVQSLAVASFRFIGRIVRGLFAATVLTALVGGLPWALVHFVGWPLPDYVPTWDELQAVLLAPMTPEFLIDVLACVLWLLWTRFTFDVVAAIPDMIRATSWPRHSRRGPLHAVAGVLVGAVVVSVLSSRTTTSTTPAKVAAAEFAASEPTPAAVALYSPTPRTATSSHPAGSTEIVRHPEHGVHDSLWRIAERCLGDGARWPEIWTLNKNTAQIDGRMFTTPNLIYPGWELQLPVPTTNKPDIPIDEPPVPSDAPSTESPGHDPDEQPHGPDSRAPASTQLVPTEPAEPAHPVSAAPPGISTSTGAFVGIGLAALITVALITVRLHRRRRYRPGTSTLDDPGRAPVVRALRIAHDVTMSLDDDTPHTPTRPDATRLDDLETRDRAQVTALAAQPAQDETALGVRNGQTVALNVTHSRGLGLIGLGAHAAARALLVSMLARTTTTNAQVVIPAADARALFGRDLPARSTTRLRVLDNLAMTLDVLETELLTRARRAAAPNPPCNQVPLVLVATPTEDTARRTQAILENGSGFNVAGILLGQWRAGGTIRARDDGTVSATSPNLANQLTGARLFTLPSTDAADLLDLLSHADSTREPTATADEEPATATADGYDFVLAEQADDSEQEPATPVAEHRPAPPVPGDVQERVSAIDAPLLSFQILDRLHLTHTGTNPADIIDAIAPRQREILVYLALHRTGCRRESLTTALWPDAPGDRPYNSFHATLSQLRRALRKATHDAIPNFVVNDDNHYQLNTSLVTVDLWQLQDALTTRRRASTPPERMAAIQRITELYRGDLATGIAADWIDPAREALRREVLEALSATIRAVDDDPEQMLTWLEKARRMDPYNEAIYRDLMRVQARLGQYDSIPRTLSLLTTSLAELDQRPTRDTLGLADFLQRMPAHRPPTREAS